MNVNIDEAWTTWSDIDDAAETSRVPELEVASVLIPQLIVEIQRLRIEQDRLNKKGADVEAIVDPGIVVYLEFDDPAYDWGTVSFVVVGDDDRIEDTVDDVVSVREFNSKFHVSNGKITYVVPKVSGQTYELTKALAL